MKIFFVNGVRGGEEIDFAVPEITIGREVDNLLSIPADGMSRYHARLQRDAQGVWRVSDSGSTNGVKVNRTRIAEPTVLREGDLIEFGDQMIRVTELSAAPGKVVFDPVVEELPPPSPLPPPSRPMDATVPIQPLPPPAVSPANPAVAVAPAAAPAHAAGTAHELSEALKSGKLKLFGGKNAEKAAAVPASGDPADKPRRIFSNRLFYTVVFCAVVVAISCFYLLNQQKPKQNVTGEKRLDPKAVLLFYEKEVIEPDNIFRFVLQVENGKAVFTIDDLKSQRRFQREIPVVNESNLEMLFDGVARGGFMTLKSPPAGTAPENQQQRRRMVVGEGGKINEVTVLNNSAPKSFEDLEYAIGVFADGYGLQTIAMTPEELRDQAERSFIKAEDLFANREAKLSNLRAAIQRYAVTVNYLEQFSPKPALWDKARKRLEEAEKIRRLKLQELNYERIRLGQFKEFDQLRYVLNQIMELRDPDSVEYDNARRALFNLDNYLNKVNKRK